MIRRPPRSTRTDTLFPYTTLFRSPSLSRVATSLIHQMTNGVLTSVEVDEDMNIMVDGQDIATLSGAGATVANLAIRIGLGRVLVSRIFPVFIGDEIDSAMDAERAEATAVRSEESRLGKECVRTCRSWWAQEH